MSRQTGAQLGKMPELSTDRRFHNLSREQVQTLDQVLTEVIPIHGRGNFPTLEVKPKDIIHVVKDRLVRREVKVRDVRLNGSTASHVLVKENGTSYKDLDIIFGVELPRQEDFQIIKEVVLGCLLDFLPQGVNKDKITALTMKEAYVQKMVKVFNEHDRWSLISLSNNRGKNVELKFVSSLRRQFEFSVDSFQIILDSMLESYLEAEKSDQCQMRGDETPVARGSRQLAAAEESPSTPLDLKEPSTKALDLQSQDERLCQNKEMVLQVDKLPQPKEAVSETVQPEEPLKNKEPQKNSESLEGAGVELGIKAELRVLSLLETFRDILLPETHTQTEVSLETSTLSSSETPAHAELLTIPEAKDIVSEIPSPAVSPGTEEAKTPEAPFDHPVQLCTTLTEKTQNSLLEKLSPPPSKKTCKKSKMVVLKHSSPKPPRKMSKKVRNVRNTSPSPEKTSLVNEFPVLTNPCPTPESDPAKIIFEAHSNQSMPEEEPNTLMDPPQSRTSTSLDKECQVHLECQDHIVLSEDGPPQACGTQAQAESTCSQSQHQEPEIPLEVGLSQKAEPDCGDIAQESVDQEPGLSALPINSQNEVTPRSQEVDTPVTPRELPAITVVAESMYGDFEQAMDHLRYRLIATRNPEEIRGGGLLKYSNLLVRDFRPASETEIKTLERYMCSRFFIDFPDVNEQQRKIESYLRNHFIGEESSKYDYLMTLRRVINESTVCLMGHERRQTLNMITVLALKVLGEQNAIPNTTNVTCFYQPAPYMADHNFNNYYIAHNQPPLIYHPYPLHIHMQTSLV